MLVASVLAPTTLEFGHLQLNIPTIRYSSIYRIIPTTHDAGQEYADVIIPVRAHQMLVFQLDVYPENDTAY